MHAELAGTAVGMAFCGGCCGVGFCVGGGVGCFGRNICCGPVASIRAGFKIFVPAQMNIIAAIDPT